MTDREALERAVILSPLDDLPRLVYADWLDENGGDSERSRATFIRSQIGYSRLPNLCENPGNSPDVLLDSITSNWFYRKRCRCKVCKLRRAAYQSSCRFIVWDWNPWAWEKECRPHIDSWSRGFPSSVTLPSLAAYERHGREIVSRAPVVEITIAELEPYDAAYGLGDGPYCRQRTWDWHDDDLPKKVFARAKKMHEHGKFYDSTLLESTTREAAMSLAARAFADEARERANLPPVWCGALAGGER